MDKKYRWYVVYTKSRAEKKTEELLKNNGVETYLPLVKTLRQWSDRKKKVEMPLISSYVFVKANISNYIGILRTEGVVSFVKFNGKPASVPDFQIDAIRMFLKEAEFETKINNGFIQGEKVEITYGPFKGFKGEVVNQKNKQLLVINILQLRMSIRLEISAEKVIKV